MSHDALTLISVEDGDLWLGVAYEHFPSNEPAAESTGGRSNKVGGAALTQTLSCHMLLTFLSLSPSLSLSLSLSLSFSLSHTHTTHSLDTKSSGVEFHNVQWKVTRMSGWIKVEAKDKKEKEEQEKKEEKEEERGGGGKEEGS